MKRNAYVRLGLTAVLAGSFFAATASAQSALERLERQIRQRAEQPAGGEKVADGPVPPPPPAPGNDLGKPNDVEPGYLGVVADDQNDRGRGVRILAVHPASPGEKAGLRRQDLVTAIAGIRVRQMSDMSDILETFGAGQVLEFDILRDGKSQKVKVTLGQRPAAGPKVEEPKPAGLPETVPLPPGALPGEPPEPPAEMEPGPQLEPPKAAGPQAEQAKQIEELRRRVENLERRVAELERALAKSAK